MSEHSIYELNQRQQYMMQMRPLLRKHALFADGTKDYRNPPEPKANEEVELTFRSSRNNVDAVWLCGGNRKIPMKKQESRGEFDYYRVKVQLGAEPYHYHFEVATGMLYCCYDRMGVSSQVRPVVVTGNVPTYQIGTDSFQEIDITGITLPITKHNYFVGAVEDLADTIREAFRLAMSGRPGPVLVDIPKDIQIAKCAYEPGLPVTPDAPRPAKDVRIQEAAQCINDAQRPFLYFGGGLVISGAQKELLELADLIDAPIGCSLMGISALPTDTPRFLGMQGMHGHYAASMAMHHADCIIALGGRFNDRVTGNRAKFATGAKIVHIDVDGSELSKNMVAAHGLRGDIRLTLQKLLPLIRPTRRPRWQETVKGFQNAEAGVAAPEGLTPQNAILALNRRLNENTPVATDVGQHQMWAAQNLTFRRCRRFLSSGGLGTMGFGMGAAIGAQMGTGERTVLITGDGSFGMNLTELATAVTNRVPLVILLLNNGVLGMVRQWQTLFFDKHYSNTILDRKTDFVRLAEAFGAGGEAVDTLEGLDAALERAFTAQGPYLIDCAIGQDELVLPMLPPGGSMDDIIVKVGD